MKLPAQMLICAAWLLLVYYKLSRPPAPPPNFPENEETVAARDVYNPLLVANLDQSLRDFWQKPDQVLEALGDLEGLKVADIGCGEGYFTLRLLDLVGPEGKVYATDIQQELLDKLVARIPRHLVPRIETILTGPDSIGIKSKVDLILLVQVLGEVSDRRGFLEQLRDLMDEDSRLALIDSKHITDTKHGFTRPLNLNLLMRELEQVGFELVPGYDAADYNFLPKQFYFVLRLRRPHDTF